MCRSHHVSPAQGESSYITAKKRKAIKRDHRAAARKRRTARKAAAGYEHTTESWDKPADFGRW